MWIKTNKSKSKYATPDEILDYDNIEKREVNTARQTITLYLTDKSIVILKPWKHDYKEWLSMLRYSRLALNPPQEI